MVFGGGTPTAQVFGMDGFIQLMFSGYQKKKEKIT
jgi:hypothetical protein